jgi:DNA modification methylase
MTLDIRNPKQDRRRASGQDAWYPYYAGFSASFAVQLIRSARLDGDDVILDPWNGAGTTTAVARSLGIASIGIDLNPVMVVTAKARALSYRTRNSLVPILSDILTKAQNGQPLVTEDPLQTWFTPSGASALRTVSDSIAQLLIKPQHYPLTLPDSVESLSDLAAFFVTALFRTARRLARPFVPSNPTWMRRPKLSERLNVTHSHVVEAFRNEVLAMIAGLNSSPIESTEPPVRLKVGSSNDLPLPDSSIDLVVTSPPYCTRIDYAVATMPELAILGFELSTEFDKLRRTLLGTSTVPKTVCPPLPDWGTSCNQFLKQVYEHSSHASSGYYWKSHVQYFGGLFESVRELRRVLRPKGRCAIVVQDSYYKNIHNDLPTILSEMAGTHGLEQIDRVDFPANNLMSRLNPATRKYRPNLKATESVVVVERT